MFTKKRCHNPLSKLANWEKASEQVMQVWKSCSDSLTVPLRPTEAITCLFLSFNQSFSCHLSTLEHTTLSFFLFCILRSLNHFARMQLPACLPRTDCINWCFLAVGNCQAAHLKHLYSWSLYKVWTFITVFSILCILHNIFVAWQIVWPDVGLLKNKKHN